MISARSIRALLVVLGFCGLCALYFFWAGCDTLTDLGGDSANYMLMARSLSPFLVADRAVVEFAEHATYPPLFPAIIGLSGGSFAAAHAVVVASLLLGSVFLFFWLRTLELRIGQSAAIVLLFALAPGTYLLALKIWSENPYLCASLLALWAMARAQPGNSARPWQGWWWIASIGAATALMIRAAGVPLALATAVFLAWKRPRGWPVMVAVVWAPFLAWVIWSRVHATGVTIYTQQLSGLYGDDAVRHVFAQIASEFPALVAAWPASWVDQLTPWPQRLVVSACGCVCVAACFVRLGRPRFDAVYVVLYLIMLMLWPWPSEAPRLLYPVCPVLLGQGFWACKAVAARVGHDRAGRGFAYGLTIMLGLTILPTLMVTAKRRLQPVPEDMQLVRYIPNYYVGQGETAAITALLINDLQRLGRLVGADDCVFTIKPATVVLLAGRRGLLPPLADTNDEDFRRGLGACRYAYLMFGQSATFPEPFYPGSRLPERSQVISALWNKTGDGELLAELVDLTSTQSP